LLLFGKKRTIPSSGKTREPRGKVKPGTGSSGRRWFLLTVALSCVTLLGIVFSLWELIERRYFRDVDYVTLHYLYITRGIASALLIGFWAAWYVSRERLHYEKQLEQSYERYRSILNHMPEAVILLDEKHRVLEWNEAAEHLFGFPRAEVLGNVVPTVPAERRFELEEALERVAKDQEVIDYETQRRTAQGESIPVAVSYSRIPALAGQPQFFVEVAQDIRPRLRMRDKLLELEKLTLMGQMAAGTAHHLNTPLTAMLLQVEMLRQQARDLAHGTELGAIEQRIRFCQAFVQNLLQFARRPQLQQKPVALCEVIEAVLTLIRPSLALKRATVQIKLEELRESRIFGDPNHLEAMFSALVSNAVDAIPIGGSIAIRGRACAGNRAEICIEDDGPGIPVELWERVFDPFFTTKPAGQGTGLGLAIARNIAEEHGGALQLENREGAGLRAMVRLPLLSQAAGVASEAKEMRA
jgi:PAS domain S-box-containing protein